MRDKMLFATDTIGSLSAFGPPRLKCSRKMLTSMTAPIGIEKYAFVAEASVEREVLVVPIPNRYTELAAIHKYDNTNPTVDSRFHTLSRQLVDETESTRP